MTQKCNVSRSSSSLRRTMVANADGPRVGPPLYVSKLRADVAAGDAPLSIAAHYYPQRGATLVTVYAADHPGLFYRIAGAIHLAGGNIIDARIHTTRDGVAIDNFLVQDPMGGAFHSPEQLTRIRNAIEDSLSNRHRLITKLSASAAPPARRPRSRRGAPQSVRWPTSMPPPLSSSTALPSGFEHGPAHKLCASRHHHHKINTELTRPMPHARRRLPRAVPRRRERCGGHRVSARHARRR